MRGACDPPLGMSRCQGWLIAFLLLLTVGILLDIALRL